MLDLSTTLSTRPDLGGSDTDRCKALYRRGLALCKLQNQEDAIKDLQEAVKLSPEDKLIQRELASAQKQIKDKVEKERKAYAKMFA